MMPLKYSVVTEADFSFYTKTLLTLTLNAKNSSAEGLVMTIGGLDFLAFLPLDALLIEEVQLPLSDEFFLSTIVGGGGAAFFFRLRPKVVVFCLSETFSIERRKKVDFDS